jgi:hypothetical protein
MRHFCIRLLCLGLLFSAAASAATIDWTVSGLMTGSLNSVTFANAPFTLTLEYDPSQVTYISGNHDYYSAPGTPGSISIAGVGGGAFTAPDLYVWSNPVSSIYNYPCPCTGFSYWGSADIFDVYDAGLLAWNLQSPLGPMTVTWRNLGYSGQVPTTAGELVITSADLTFEATNSGTATPEPAGLVLTGLGLAMAGILRRRHT